MGLLGSLVKTAVLVAVTPLAVASDAVSKGAGYRPKATKKALREIAKSVYDVSEDIHKDE